MNIRDESSKFLAHKMRTESEVRKRLREKGFSDEETDAEICALCELKYIDDADYARSYLLYAFGKGRALSRVKYELQLKGVEKLIIEQACYDYEDEFEKDLTDEETKRALAVARRFAVNNDMTEQKNSDRLARKLNSLGYSSSLISETLKSIRKHAHKETDG